MLRVSQRRSCASLGHRDNSRNSCRGFKRRPASSILASEIEAIRRAMGSGAHVEPHPLLKCGDWVRVKCGPLAGIRGVLVRKKNAYRLVLSVEMLGKAAAVEVDAVLTERLTRSHRRLATPCT